MTNYVNTIDQKYQINWSSSSKDKVMIGCVANALQPGAASQVSIFKDQWIGEQTLHLDPVHNLNQFIKKLLHIQ